MVFRTDPFAKIFRQVLLRRFIHLRESSDAQPHLALLNPRRGDRSAGQTGACMSGMENEKRAPLVDPIESASEIVFGLNTTPTFSDSLSVARVGARKSELSCRLAARHVPQAGPIVTRMAS
jgi:hypothetical protein